MRQLRVIGWSWFALLVSACSSGQFHTRNGKVEKSFFQINLQSTARIGIARSLKTPIPCLEIPPDAFQVVILDAVTGKKIELIRDCETFANRLWVRTKEAQKKGVYRFEVIQNRDSIQLREDALVRTQYEDAEFGSGPDQRPVGAVELKDGNISESVSYDEGDRSDWIRIPGDSGWVSLQFSGLKVEKKRVYATAFRASKGTTRVRMVASLPQGRSKKLRLNESSDLYVRVRSYLYRGRTPYILKRQGVKANPSIRVRAVQIADCFSISKNESLALISQPQGLKIGDQVQLLGQIDEEKSEVIGACEVVSLHATQANCQMSVGLKKIYIGFTGRVTL